MQKAYISALYELMKSDSRVYSLLSDSGTDYDLLMARDFPDQCFNFGISEQHKVAAAAGMAAMGKIPFVYTTGTFLAYRACEFIRDDICLQRRNVKLVGMGMGMGSWSTLGATHHSTEDIALLRAIPGLTLFSASTPRQVSGMVRAAYAIDGPVYIRMGMSGEDELYDEKDDYRPYIINTLLTGSDVVVFSTGTILGETYRAVERLNASGYSIGLVDVHTLNPLDEAGILSSAQEKKLIITVEEHSIRGGLGGAIAETLSAVGSSLPLYRLGLDNCFAEGYGRTAEVRALNGLDADGIYMKIKNTMDNYIH